MYTAMITLFFWPTFKHEKRALCDQQHLKKPSKRESAAYFIYYYSSFLKVLFNAKYTAYWNMISNTY